MATLTPAELFDRLRPLNPEVDDEGVLRRFSVHLSEYLRAQAHIEEHGVIVSHPRTNAPIPNPYCVVRDRAEAGMARIAKFEEVRTDGLWGDEGGDDEPA